MKEKIEKIIKTTLNECQKEGILPPIEIPKIEIDFSKEKFYGDYTTNLALNLAKLTKKPPQELATYLVSKLKLKSQNLFEKIEAKEPGFINFFLSEKILTENLKKVLKEKEKYGSSKIGKGKVIIIDYSSPNIAKPFGIGHLRSTIIGQAIYNIYKFLGWKCIGDNHLGDWGTQFGNLIFAIKKWGKKIKPNSLENLEKLYIMFHKEAEINPSLKEEGKKEFKKLEEGEKKARKIWKKCVDLSLREYERIYKLLGVKIDYAFGESFYEPFLKDVIKEAKEKGVAKESQGALVIQFPEKELPPAILLKSDGATTYFTRDLATIKFRLKKWNPELIVYEVGAEQTLHFKQLFRAVELLGWAKKEKFFHLAHGLYRTQTGKFSTRKGKTIHLEDVLNEAIERAKEIIEKSKITKKFSKKEKEKIAKIVGIGAIKFNDLSEHPSREIIFDWNKILNLKGKSAPYLQYTFVRCKSLLKKANFKISSKKIKQKKLEEIEKNILREIFKFPEVVEESAKKFSPNLISNYAFELAKEYNLFYESFPILKAPPKERIFRLALTSATAQVIKNSLWLLGISVPEKM